ncbi:MAG: V-type ATP synthase subunit E family protein [Gammaproteobacteria bacterium]|nr:V-type ATP synthase subunit E family protein [Gammaproteobacteria bacterium]
MATEADQVRALQAAILERARELSAEHVSQGEMSRAKVIADMREKLKLMEEKELLSARVHAEREYHRRVQASELRIRAELDRNRWGLVQAVMDKLARRLVELREDESAYRPVFLALLRNGVEALAQPVVVAAINNGDRKRYHKRWSALVVEACGDSVEVRLAPETCSCSGGVRLVTLAGDCMIDNTFEGIIARREQELQRLVFERLFAHVAVQGSVIDG